MLCYYIFHLLSFGHIVMLEPNINKTSVKLAKINLDHAENMTGNRVMASLIANKPEVSFLGVNELAELFGVNRSTLYHWKACGMLPDSFKMGKRRYWRLSDLKQCIDALVGQPS